MVGEMGEGEDWGWLGGVKWGEGGMMDVGAGRSVFQLREWSHLRVCKRLDSGGFPRPKERSPDCSLGSRGEGT